MRRNLVDLAECFRQKVLFLFLTLVVAACATAEAETPAQRVFAIQSEYTAIQQVVVAYVEGATADEKIKSHLQELDKALYLSIKAAQTAVRHGGGNVEASISAAASALASLTTYIAEKGINGSSNSDGTTNLGPGNPVNISGAFSY